MMKRTTLMILVVALFAGCRKGPSPLVQGGLRVIISPEWQGQPFQTGTEYHNITDYRVFFDPLRAYLAEARLVGQSGDAELFDIDLFDLSNGPVERNFTVEPGTYDMLHLGLGVPEALNHSDPTQYPNTHPLSLFTGTHWNWTTGYRFVIFEGRYDTDPNGTGTVLPTWSIHTGLDTCYRTMDLQPSLPIVITSGDVREITLHVEMSRFFYSSTDTLDIDVDTQFHGGTNVELGIRSADLMTGAFSLD